MSSGLDLGFLKPGFLSQCPSADLRMAESLGALEEIEVAVCWNPPRGMLARMPGLRLIQSIGAGVDHVLADPELPRNIPVCRVIDPGMASGMAAYVLWAVIHQQRHFDRYLAHAARRRWQEEPIVSPRRHVVGIAGYGWLGSACARALTTVGFSVRGWHRGAVRPAPPGVALYRGEDQLDAFLEGCNALVCLLPLTPQTSGFLSSRVFTKLPKGAHVINVGRGAHLVESDLLDALATGQIAAATLDAFSDEPLPREHPFWSDPRIIVTPHIASRTDLAVIAAQTLENLAQVRRGLRPEAAVDLQHGY